MSSSFDNIKSIGGLNSDDEVRVIPSGDYLTATNIRNAVTTANRGGTLTNVMGNLEVTTYICPYNGGSFPSGRNRCIGAVEDMKYGGALFFVWNSLGKHGIYRYFRNVTNPSNPFGVVEQVIQFDFGWKKQTRITSANIVYGDPTNEENIGDLLYWCDPKPRKINFTKGNVVNKKKSWDIFLPETISGNITAPLIFTVKNFAGSTIYTKSINVTATTRNELIQEINTAINNDATSPIVSEACDCQIKFAEKVSGVVWTITDNQDALLVVPTNWYGATLIERYFDRPKYPALQAPQPTYAKDDAYEPNYVQNKVFQFRLQYLYDDKEPSALGVWSQIATNNLGCNGSSNVSYNYIDIDFNDSTLIDPSVLVLLKKVRLVARELNTGKDRAVIDLSPCDFLDYVGGGWVARFKFYNDIISSPIDDATSAKIYDDVPLEVGAEILKDNRMVEGNCLVGYNPPDCIDADYTIDFADNPNPKLYKISGLIRIYNFRMDNNATQNPANVEPNILERRSAILYDTTMSVDGETVYPFFGGSFYDSSTVEINSDFAYNKKRQLLPEGGFPVYLAGTDYFTISKQRIINNVTQRSDGSLDVSNGVAKDQVKAVYDDFTSTLNDDADIFSTFELNVPAGEYVIRLASHWCSFDDKLGKGFMYDLSKGSSFQKTSTFVWGVNDFGIGSGYRYDYEIKVTVTNSDVFVGEFLVTDLVYPNPSSIASILPSHSGYLIDNFGQTDVVPLSQGATVEKALVYQTDKTFGTIYDTYTDKITDHNGFFFLFPSISPTSNYANRFTAVQVGGEMHIGSIQYAEDINGFSALKLLADQTINTSYPTDPIPSHLEIILPSDVANARLVSSTFVTGKIVDTNGNEISGATVLLEHGRFTITDSNGDYAILTWGDMRYTPYNAVPIPKRIEYLIVTASPFCLATYPSGQSVYIEIDPFGSNTTSIAPPYSPTAKYEVVDFEIDEANNPSIKAHKRGGNYTYGIRCYDEAGRLCSVVKAFDVYVPFITEDLHNSLPNQYAPNTYKYGKPRISWTLSAGFQFPSWVKTFQWMRTTNSIYGRYLQWVANQVTYLSATETIDTPEIPTTFQNANAVAIKISLSNLTNYLSYNNNSLVGYSYQAGDRLRLIADRNLDGYEGLIEFEITSYDETTQSIIIKAEVSSVEIKSGTLLEIFNPKSVETSEQQRYYEVGEVIGVTNGTPQTYSGVFTNGDTYWRGRFILVNDDATKFTSAYPVVIEDASVSDFYVSEAQDIGRVGIVDPNFKQIRRPMLLKASNKFIPATAENGLSSFEALNEKELDRANGQIQRLVSINQTIVAVSNVRETSNYIQVVTFQQASQGQGVLAIADQYFGTDYPHAKTLGTDLPNSVVVNDGTIFGFHSQRSDVWQYRGDGELCISDVKMKNYFQSLGNSGVSDAAGIFDRFYEEYLLTSWRKYKFNSTVASRTNNGRGYDYTFVVPTDSRIPQLYSDAIVEYQSSGVWNAIDGEITAIDGNTVTFTTSSTIALANDTSVVLSHYIPETVSWFNGNDFDNKKRWVTFYDFTPENYCQIASEIISFVDGKIWIHGKNETRNSFYGVRYPTKVKPVFNAQPELLKVWNACVLKTRQIDGGNDWYSPVITNDNGQLSRLVQGSWVKRGEDFFASFKRDLNDTTKPLNTRIANGRVLRSSTLTCELVNDFDGEVVLYSWNANYTLSERTSK